MPKARCYLCSSEATNTTVYFWNPLKPKIQLPTQQPPKNTSLQPRPPPIALPPSRYNICTHCSTSNCVFVDEKNHHFHNWSSPVYGDDGFQIWVYFNSHMYLYWKCAHCDSKVYI